MKILMICEFFDDGLDYQENLLARAYHLMGHEVVIVASTILSLSDYVRDADLGKGERQEQAHDWGKLIRVPFQFNILHRIKRFKSILSVIEEVKPNLLYFHDIIPNLDEGVQYVRANPDCAMIMDYHGDASNSGANFLSRRVLHGIVRKRILDLARPYLRKILPVTPGSANFLRELYRVPDEEMELLPLGTNQLYAEEVLAGDARERVRTELGIAQDALVVFSGGKLSPYKRTQDLLSAVEGLSDLPIHVIVVGAADPAHGDYVASITKLAERNPKVHMVGWQDRAGVYAHMAASDIAVFPASQSVLWQQSLGMGLPLIVSERSQGLRGVQHVNYLNRHDNLIVLDPDVPLASQIETHLLRLATDHSARLRMAEGAKQTAADILDYAALASRTLEFIGRTSEEAVRA